MVRKITTNCVRLLLAVAVLAMLAPRAHAAGAMRCGSRIVDEGKLAAEVLVACGQPQLRDVWSYPAPGGRGWIADVEQWYYNFGSSQLLRVLTLRDGVVSAIDADGYGFATPVSGHCGPGDIVPGLSKYRLLMRCGEPLTRRADNLLRPLRDRPVYRPDLNAWGSDNYVVPVYHEEWVYNFGSRYLMRVVSIDNGRVVQVDNGDRGGDFP